MYLYNFVYNIVSYIHNFVAKNYFPFCVWRNRIMTTIYLVRITRSTLLKKSWRVRVQCIIFLKIEEPSGKNHSSYSYHSTESTTLVRNSMGNSFSLKGSLTLIIPQVSNHMIVHNQCLTFCLLRIPLQCQI